MRLNHLFGFLLVFSYSIFADKVLSDDLKSSLRVKCEYLECSDLKGSATCSPRTKPVQFFDFFFNSKQVKDENNSTSNIIKATHSNILFGRSYNKDAEYYSSRGAYDKVSELYSLNRTTYNLTKEVRITELIRDGDLDRQGLIGLHTQIKYKGKCSVLPIEKLTY